MSFNFLTREPRYFDCCTMFRTNDDVFSTCEAVSLRICSKDGAWTIVAKDEGPVYTRAIDDELNDLVLDLLAWWGGSEFNSELLVKWLNGDYAIPTDRSSYCRSFGETDTALYLIEIEVDDYEAPSKADVYITAFNRDFVTDNATASRLIDACKEVQDLPYEVRDLTFAKAVCADLLQNLGDAPAIQNRLRTAITRLDKLIHT